MITVDEKLEVSALTAAVPGCVSSLAGQLIRTQRIDILDDECRSILFQFKTRCRR